ncbi:hypothetical protein COCSUDRAFT_67698 [Coccomyxa subellipsoidea C-169]|uniref:EF-hand domain-containing protein n=1 Tax=Coccomyxa subellipsoidea (strain C-169) TaxID=574566 RepID=I0YMD5_COCSC|nr:hypothetical protein COCSUDRAFT_67698 [Coccomyxa subellipsoidea C-169]EIE19554.1 hypothetical protein COCSUDRAFT_67698 [Coccomyxa subellipsoidea C-169]|eukprot:XP_005644098.1 hypothetical protein COCSUDRAFT_67698 [Coccomyxa subellipsoidea C-169]
MNEAEVQSAKVARIFKAFDANCDGGLSKAELLTFVARVNPTVKFTPVQLTAIADEVCLEYAQHVVKAGLTEDGLRAMYESGNGNVNDDYEALELDESSGAATADAATQPHEVVPQKENIDVNESDTAEAEPSVRESWAGKLGKWAAALKPTIAAAPAAEPKQASPEHHTAEGAVDILSADMKQAQAAKGAGREKVTVPKLALGAAAGAAEDAWTIKAHAETSSQIEVRRATAQTKTAEESIATAKRELASYKQVKHEAAIRAVTAAKRALGRGAGASADIDGTAAMAAALDAVADAKRALNSHPLPDAAQPAGAAESVTDAQRALAVIPTEYDDDGPVPPLPETLAAIEAAREALERYPLAAEPGSPLPASLSPGPKSHRIHITASPSHHSYAPEAARKSLDGDGAARGGAAHGYVPSSGGPPAVATAGQPRGHAYVPPAPEGGPTANGASAAAGHSYVPDGKPNGAKTLRKSLTKLAHRFVPGAASKGAAAPRPSLSEHTFLPDAPAKDAKEEDVPAVKYVDQQEPEEGSPLEAVTPTRGQEELSKWFNHAWDPNQSRRPQPERTTSDAENFVDAKEEMHTADSFTSAHSAASPTKQQQEPPLVHALSARLSGPNGMLSCLGTPPRTPRAATAADLPATAGGSAAAALPTATPRQAARAAEAAAAAAAERVEAEAALQLREGESDTLQLVLESVQRIINFNGDAEWTNQQLAKLRARADALDADEAYSAHIATAGLLASMRRHDEAIPCYEAALSQQPSNAKAWFRLGISLFAVSRFLDAEQAYLRAMQARSLLLIMAECMQEVAMAMIRRLLRGVEVTMPKDARLMPKIHVNLGITLEGDGRLLAACDAYREAVRLNPEHFRALKLLGSALYALGDLEEAESALRASLAINPDYSDTNSDLGCVLCALQRPEEAKVAFKRAIASQPEHSIEAHFNLGNVFRQCGEFEAAERCYQNVLTAAPGHWRALLNLSVALAGLGRNSEAHKALRASFKASGSNARVTAEINKLKAMARRGLHRTELTALMEIITDTATVAVATKPDKPSLTKKGWPEMPKRGLSGLLRRPSPAAAANSAESLQASIDEGLLKQLGPIAAIHPYRLEAQVTEEGFLASACPSPAAAGSSTQATIQTAAVAEAVLRRVLSETAMPRFQHLMRIVLHDFIKPLDPTASCRETDVGLVLALLAAVTDGDSFERADAVHALLRWRTGNRGGIYESSVALYIAGLKAVYGKNKDTSELRKAMAGGEWGDLVQLKTFQEQLKSAFPAFDMLRGLAAGN